MKNGVIFLGHLGLGDHIIQQGIVNNLASQYKRVLIFCKHHNFKSVEYMCGPNVDIVSVNGDAEVHQMYPRIRNCDVVSVGFYNKNWGRFSPEETTFDRYFYKQAAIDFETSYEVEFEEPQQEPNDEIMQLAPAEPFCFVHDDAARGLKIDMSRVDTDLPVVRPSIKAEKIFDYIPLIKKASEIHCIDSSFALMIDRINTKDNKYIHRYTRKDSFNPSYRSDWEIYE